MSVGSHRAYAGDPEMLDMQVLLLLVLTARPVPHFLSLK
jgi:hypothetical protein